MIRSSSNSQRALYPFAICFCLLIGCEPETEPNKSEAATIQQKTSAKSGTTSIRDWPPEPTDPRTTKLGRALAGTRNPRTDYSQFIDFMKRGLDTVMPPTGLVYATYNMSQTHRVVISASSQAMWSTGSADFWESLHDQHLATLSGSDTRRLASIVNKSWVAEFPEKYTSSPKRVLILTHGDTARVIYFGRLPKKFQFLDHLLSRHADEKRRSD